MVVLALISLVLSLTKDEWEMVASMAALADVSLHSYVLVVCGAAVLVRPSVEGKHCALSVAEENVVGG